LSRSKVFIPLDFPTARAAWPIVEKLLPLGPGFKVGLELFVAEGPAFVRGLRERGAEIFLDLKFHDIPNTVAGAIRSASELGVSYFNVHCGGGGEMLRAAARARDEAARKGAAPKLLGVTVLTSLDDQGVQEVGFGRSASAQVKLFVELAQACGLDGVVCSAQELALVRQLAGPAFVTMIPGIRPAGSAAGDQKRTMTPKEAAAAGADYLVIGRPITGAPDPVEALRKVLAEL
jgi:orotidine-5'-phosphate decarboxylase